MECAASKWLTVEEVKEKIEKVFGADTGDEVPELADLTVGTFEWFCEIFAHADRQDGDMSVKNPSAVRPAEGKRQKRQITKSS